MWEPYILLHLENIVQCCRECSPQSLFARVPNILLSVSSKEFQNFQGDYLRSIWQLCDPCNPADSEGTFKQLFLPSALSCKTIFCEYFKVFQYVSWRSKLSDFREKVHREDLVTWNTSRWRDASSWGIEDISFLSSFKQSSSTILENLRAQLRITQPLTLVYILENKGRNKVYNIRSSITQRLHTNLIVLKQLSEWLLRKQFRRLSTIIAVQKEWREQHKHIHSWRYRRC
jgi:hypothetical protein